MKPPTITFDTFDVVAVPFPFTDKNKTKRRPALVLSAADHFNNASGHSVLAMITSSKNAPWPLDVKIEDLPSAGLTAPSVIRMKLFTLDHRFIHKKIGTLAKTDQPRLKASLRQLFQKWMTD
jgi:mRNA interferase MazF